MAAISDIFFGVIENGSVYWYGTRLPQISDVTPPIYQSKYIGVNKVKVKKNKLK
jgi:hypothetical protein